MYVDLEKYFSNFISITWLIFIGLKKMA